MRHIISCFVENHPGVLARVAGLFSARGFNIDSLNVGTTIDPTVSRMTIVSTGDDQVISQIIKQLEKLIDVIEVRDLTQDEHVERELLLIKIECNKENRREVIELADIFRAKIVDCGPESMVIEVVGAGGKVNGFFNLLQNYRILQITRTGRVALPRAAATSAPQSTAYGVTKDQHSESEDQV
ncbi:acetolactate synthase small subunit [Candidatus Sumerlaeota bacterium]|nr:acetolactate synthase small subunit [Candidatus Sumerlaeota bacterium]